MAGTFCARTARRIQRPGYPTELAGQIARFFYISMRSVCGATLLVLNGGRAVPVLPVSSFDMPGPARVFSARARPARGQGAAVSRAFVRPVSPAIQRLAPVL